MSDKNQKGEIPVLKKKEKKEKKGGAIIVGHGSGGGGGIIARWFGVGARPAGSALKAGAARVGGRAGMGLGKSAVGMKLGLLPSAINFASSNLGVALLTIALSAASVYSLFTFGLGEEKLESREAVFPVSSSSAEEDGGKIDVYPGSINFFASANKGKAFNRNAPASDKEVIDGAAAEEDLTEEDGVEEVRGGAPDLAEELVAQMEKPKLLASKKFGSLGKGNGLAGGSGMSSGVMRTFTPRAEKKRAITALKPTRKLLARRGARSISRVKGKGPLKQLRFTNRKSVKSLGRSSAEGSSFEAAEAFSAAPASVGGEIGGAGVSQGGEGMSGGANPNTDSGGPLGNGSRGEESVDRVGPSEDKAPYSPMVMMAMALLLAASTVIAITGLLSSLAQKPSPLSGYLAGMAKAFYMMAIGMAAAATMMGIMIMQEYGQKTQGMIITTGGAITTTMGALALMGDMKASTSNWLAIIGGIVGMAASVGAMLAPSGK